MKCTKSWMGLIPVISLLCLCLYTVPAWSEPLSGTTRPSEDEKAADVKGSYLEDVTFEKMALKERMTIFLSRQAGARVEGASRKSVAVTLENVFVPRNLQKTLGEGVLSNLVRVVPVQKTDKGRQTAVLTVELRHLVPYRVSQEGQNVVIDFNVAGLHLKEELSATATSPEAWKAKLDTAARTGVAQAAAPVATAPATDAKKTAPAGSGFPAADSRQRNPRQQKITLDFQEANIKAVLRLMSEASGVNITSGDDVRGNMTIYIKDVPWEQALDTILATGNLIKEEVGNDVILVKTARARNLQFTERTLMELNRRKLEEELILDNSRKGRLGQIMIEAKIVEVTDQFVRDLGTQWGFGSTVANTGGTSLGILGGTSQATSVTSLTTGTALTTSALALNFPSTTVAPYIGIVAGSAYSLLQAKLSALETISQGRIISSPRVMTMEGKKAIIRQGSEIPVVTPATSTSPATTTYKAAELRLEVEPKVTPDKRISMQIQANNDRADTSNKDATTGNMPVLTNNVNSSVVVKDGDTVVIGGVMVAQDTLQISGTPWLYKIPVLGWLFKQESVTKVKKELLIFITPRVVQETVPTEQPRTL